MRAVVLNWHVLNLCSFQSDAEFAEKKRVQFFLYSGHGPHHSVIFVLYKELSMISVGVSDFQKTLFFW